MEIHSIHVWCHTPVIPNIQEAEQKESQVQGQLYNEMSLKKLKTGGRHLYSLITQEAEIRRIEASPGK
jgi:hypothetical protein